jgi:hypothetical protein
LPKQGECTAGDELAKLKVQDAELVNDERMLSSLATMDLHVYLSKDADFGETIRKTRSLNYAEFLYAAAQPLALGAQEDEISRMVIAWSANRITEEDNWAMFIKSTIPENELRKTLSYFVISGLFQTGLYYRTTCKRL